MARAAGVLTSTGGLASHAAVVARGWGIPAVVGAASVHVGDGTVVIGDRRLSAGDTITIDGSTGRRARSSPARRPAWPPWCRRRRRWRPGLPSSASRSRPRRRPPSRPRRAAPLRRLSGPLHTQAPSPPTTGSACSRSRATPPPKHSGPRC
ncbi:MAG: PEP-utilizing enzyme [Candidatus Limnocylindrales bacterium]